MTPRERFALETFEGGGVLMDLGTGAVYVLNETATFVWERSLDGEGPEHISAAFARAFGISPLAARGDVDAALTIPAPSDEPPAPSFVRYERTSDGYRIVSPEQGPLLEVGESGKSVRALAHLAPTALAAYLRVISPKVAALKGAFVLHASAVRRPNGDVVAFLGTGGAGKTTTARMFRDAGCILVSEDKVIVRFDGEEPKVVLSGERQLESSLVALCDDLLAARVGDWRDLDGSIEEIAHGASGNLSQVCLVDSARRQGETIQMQRLSPAEAGASIFQNCFLGSIEPHDWAQGMAMAARLARVTPTVRATMPDGLVALAEAARHYTEMTAS